MNRQPQLFSRTMLTISIDNVLERLSLIKTENWRGSEYTLVQAALSPALFSGKYSLSSMQRLELLLEKKERSIIARFNKDVYGRVLTEALKLEFQWGESRAKTGADFLTGILHIFRIVVATKVLASEDKCASKAFIRSHPSDLVRVTKWLFGFKVDIPDGSRLDIFADFAQDVSLTKTRSTSSSVMFPLLRPKTPSELTLLLNSVFLQNKIKDQTLKSKRIRRFPSLCMKTTLDETKGHQACSLLKKRVFSDIRTVDDYARSVQQFSVLCLPIKKRYCF